MNSKKSQSLINGLYSLQNAESDLHGAYSSLERSRIPKKFKDIAFEIYAKTEQLRIDLEIHQKGIKK